MASDNLERQSNTLLEWSQSTVARLNVPGVCYSLAVSMKTTRRIPLRIVSLAPSATSILCAIGARRALVGVTRWCAAVAPVGKLRKLGDCWHVGSVGEILRLNPTLVIGSVPYKRETVASLLEQPFPFLAMNPRTLADVAADIRLLGAIMQKAAAAERVLQKMRHALSEIEKKARRSKQRVRVYCEAWPNPRISSPPSAPSFAPWGRRMPPASRARRSTPSALPWAA